MESLPLGHLPYEHHGRRPIQQFAVANPGQATKMLHSILQILTGYYPVLFSTCCFHRNLPWLQKVLYRTNSFRRRRNTTIRCDLPSRPGRRRMAYLPCHRPAFWTYATTSGPNIPNRSPITLQNPPSTNFNPHSKAPFSTARTNMPLHSAYTAHVSTTNPLKAPFKIRPSLNNYTRRTILNCGITGRIPPSPAWKSLFLGSRLWPTTSSRIHLGQTKERISERSTHHLLRWISFSTYAQHPCSAHLSTHPVRLSRPLCHRGCVHSVVHSARSACRCWPHSCQPGSGRFLHQHWPRKIYPIMVHAPGLPPSKHSNVHDDEVFSVYPGKSNNPGDIIKGRTFRRLNVTRKIVIKHVPDLIRSALNMQTFALGKRCFRQSRGSPMGSPLSPALCLMVVSISEQIWSSTFRQILSNHHLFIRHIRYVDNRLIFGDKRLTELSSSRRRLLRKTHHPRDWTWPGISWVYARNKTFGADLSRTNQYLSSSLTLFSFPSTCPSEWLPLTLPHCHQGCFPSFSCSTRSDPINSFVHSRWVSQGGTPDNFRPTLDSASVPPIAVSNRGFPLACPRFDVVSRVVLVFLFFFPWVCLLFLFLLVCCVALCFFWQLLGSTFARSFLLAVTFLLMDHAQARAFHHHLARALMHLNYLAGLLPFFEPSIEWEDSLPPQNLRLENMRSRSLHTFVPFPPSSASPTLVTHGGIPSHMVENPEPNLRPTTLRPPTHMERDHPSTNPVGIHSPVLMSDPNPNPGNPSSITPGREILPTRQLLASLFPDSRDSPGWQLASPSLRSSRKPCIGARIWHGWRWFHHCQCGHYSTSCPDSPTGNVPLEHSHQWHRDANMAILERLEDPDDDLSRHPVQIFSAADLAHLASHLAESTRTLSDQARRMEAFPDEALWAFGLIQQMILPCILKPFPLQGTDNSLYRLWIWEKASRQRGVCVDHLHRCKTSFCLFCAFVVGSTRFSYHVCRGAVNLIPSTAQRRRWFEIVISGLIIPTYLQFSNLSSMATG